PDSNSPTFGQSEEVTLAGGDVNLTFDAGVFHRKHPTLVTTASPDITLGTTAPTITDKAHLSGGFNETGTIHFKLKLGSDVVYETDDAVNGDGDYSASYTLPTTGTAAGTYKWSAEYSGDALNHGAHDQGGADEQTIVSKASPGITTTQSAGGTVGTVSIHDN